MSLGADIADVERAREWVREYCHRAETRHTLLTALDYAAAAERAGLPPDVFTGDDLFEFLTNDRTHDAFVRHFPQPTL